jgi:UDP-N-acetylmuramyl tripeptide synthase
MAITRTVRSFKLGPTGRLDVVREDGVPIVIMSYVHAPHGWLSLRVSLHLRLETAMKLSAALAGIATSFTEGLKRP